MLYSVLLLVSLGTSLVLAINNNNQAPRWSARAARGDVPPDTLCGLGCAAIEALPCDFADDGWTILAKEYTQYYTLGGQGQSVPPCEGAPQQAVQDFLNAHCTAGSIVGPAKAQADEYAAALQLCNGAESPCNGTEPCSCGELRSLVEENVAISEQILDQGCKQTGNACFNVPLFDALIPNITREYIDSGWFPSLAFDVTSDCAEYFIGLGRINDTVPASGTTPGQGPPFNDQTLLRISSNGKLLGTTTVLKYIDRGVISISETMRTYIPEYANSSVIEPLSPPTHRAGALRFAPNHTEFTMTTPVRHNMSAGDYFAIVLCSHVTLGGYPTFLFNRVFQVKQAPSPFAVVTDMPPNGVDIFFSYPTALGAIGAPLHAAQTDITNPESDVGYISYNEYANGGPRYGSSNITSGSAVLTVEFAEPHDFSVDDTIGVQAVGAGWFNFALLPSQSYNPTAYASQLFVLQEADIVGPTTLALTYGVPFVAKTPPGPFACDFIAVKLETGAKQTFAGGVRTFAPFPVARIAGVPVYYTTKSLMVDLTVHHMLTYTSGFAYDSLVNGGAAGRLVLRTAAAIQGGLATDLGVGALSRDNANVQTLGQWTRRRALLPLINQPGEQYTYSPDASQLGHVLEIIDAQYGSGRNFETIFQDEVAEPLGMTSTFFKLAGYTLANPPPNTHVLYTGFDQYLFGIGTDSIFPGVFGVPAAGTTVPLVGSRTGVLIFKGLLDSLDTSFYNPGALVVVLPLFTDNFISTMHDMRRIVDLWTHRGTSPQTGVRLLSEAAIIVSTQNSIQDYSMPFIQELQYNPSVYFRWGYGVGVQTGFASSRSVTWGGAWGTTWVADIGNTVGIKTATQVFLGPYDHLSEPSTTHVTEVYYALENLTYNNENPQPAKVTFEARKRRSSSPQS
jgi:CubicO group peptidase (beta-lactamase class C family)